MIRPVPLPAPPHPDPYRDPIALALVAEVCERGADAGDPCRIARRAGVSIGEFETRFSGFADCLVDSYGRYIASFERSVGSAFNRHVEWSDALRAAAYAAAAWMEASPSLVHFGAIGVLQTGNEMARVRREDVVRFCADLIEQGREAAPDPELVPEGASLMAVGSIMNLLTQRLQEGTVVDPTGMVPEMMYMVVRIYLGEDEARKELTASAAGRA
jgi:AcrR family transcriptional regulator